MNQHFLKENKQTFVYFLTTNAHLSLETQCLQSEHANKVKHHLQKKVKQWVQTIYLFRKIFFCPTLPFWTEVHKWRTNLFFLLENDAR